MDDHAPDVEWLLAWRSTVTSVLERLLATFRETYGYSPGPPEANEITLAGESDRAAARALAEDPAVPSALTAFYDVIGGVSLEAVGNAYYVHAPDHVLTALTDAGPVRLTGRSGQQPGVVFASDGGGILFAIGSDGTVHRSTDAAWHTAYEPVCENLRALLVHLHQATVRFADTGRPGPL